MCNNPITLAIVDDHTAVRQAIKTALSCYEDFQFVFEGANGRELLEKLSNMQPDVLLLDIKMPQLDGIEALSIINTEYPVVRVLILSAFNDEIYVAQCLERGVNGYLTKSMEITEIAAAIRVAYKNEVYSTNLLSNSLLKNYVVNKKKKSSELLPHFSLEEISILHMLSEEKSTDDISCLLNLSKRSIELKRDKMRQKAKVKTNVGLILYAVKRGLINMTSA